MPMNNSIRLWLTSKYATSWQLALAVFLNYPVTGLFFGETVVAPSGVTNHILNLITGIICGLIIFTSSLFRKFIKAQSFSFVQIVFVISSALSILISTLIHDAVGFEKNEFPIIFSGLLQMYAIHNLYAIVVSSLMETRTERKKLEFQKARLEGLQGDFRNQIQEISSRISNVVNEKLVMILNELKFEINENLRAEPRTLAGLVSETLNEGVRPLSWNIENDHSLTISKFEITKKRIGLVERLRFPIPIKRVFSIPLLFVVYIFFDLPVMYFYFGFSASIQTIFTIGFTGLVLFLLSNFAGDRKFPSWFAITLVATSVGISSSGFLLYRQISGEITRGAAEMALVLSMVQISIIMAIFQASIVRRVAFIEDQRLVNIQLEELVSQLRQSAWVAKKKLARLVHGQVQSELFAAYLQLSQATKPDPVLYKEVSDRIEKAKGALTQTEQAGHDFESVLEQITATWGSGFKVHTDIASPALAALRKDSVASACAIEVIREGINNAAKYGTSGSASLAIDIRDNSRLYIEVLNEAESSDEIIAGYGSEILDDVTHEWNLEITDGVAKLTAEVMLNQPAG